MKEKLYLIYLDAYHQGDPLFLKELAQAFARAAPGQVPALLLHGSGEKVERTLEAEGVFPDEEGGVLPVETPRQAALVERAAREANQELVALLTDEVVSAVGLQGCDRGLLRRAEGGGVAAGTLGWVEDLVKMRVLPVVSALAEGPERAEAVPPAPAAVALAGALSGFDVTVVFLAKGRLPEEALDAADLPGIDACPEPAVARRVAEAGEAVLLASVRGLFAEGGPRGVRVRG